MTSDLYTHTFAWSGEGNHVVATGTFDNWSSSLVLTKGDNGKFLGTKELPFGDKISYKYVVDGTWKHNPDEPHESDASGNINNTFQVPEKPASTIPPAVVPLESSGEKPAEPAPTPAVPSDASVPTVPSNEDVASGVAETSKVEEPAVVKAEKEAAAPEEDKPKDDAPVIAAASAGVGALLAGAAVVGNKAFEVAGSAIEHGKEALGYSTETPAKDIATDAASKTTESVQQTAESVTTKGSEILNTSISKSSSFGTSTIAALGLGGKKTSSNDVTPPSDKAPSTTIATSEVPTGSVTETPATTVTPVPVNETPATLATPVTPTTNGGQAVKAVETPKDELVVPDTTGAAPATEATVSTTTGPPTPSKDGPDSGLPKPPTDLTGGATGSGTVKDKKKSSVGGSKREPSTVAQDVEDAVRTRKPSFFRRLKHSLGGHSKD